MAWKRPPSELNVMFRNAGNGPYVLPENVGGRVEMRLNHRFPLFSVIFCYFSERSFLAPKAAPYVLRSRLQT